MINRKLKATLSLVLALIVMCSACVVPAFALDDVSEGGLTQNVAILKVVSTMVDRVKAQGGTLDDKKLYSVLVCTERVWYLYYANFVPYGSY